MPIPQKFCISYHSERNILIDVLSLTFGLGAWVSVTGFWVELPILIDSLPEGWRISSQLSVAIQSANIGPLLWASLSWIKRGQHTGGFSIKTRRLVTHVLLIMGVIANILLAFKWNASIEISGNPHSIPLIILMFTVGLIGCTSPVLFMPQMGIFPQVHLISYLVGEGLGGFLPSIVALVQGVKDGNSNPRFGPTAFFLFISSLEAISSVSFYLLNNLPATKRAMICSSIAKSEVSQVDDKNVTGCRKTTSADAPADLLRVNNIRGEESILNEKESESDSLFLQSNWWLKKNLIKILVIQGWICFFSSGFLPGVSTYSSLPYGKEAFHLSSTLGAAIVPIGTSLAFLNKHCPKIVTIGAIATVASLLSVYTIFTAAYSPNPQLVGTKVGVVLIVLNLVLYAGLSAYVKVNSARICRKLESSLSKKNSTLEGSGKGPLFWCGAVSQGAGAIGSLLDLTLVTILGLFKSA